MSELQFSKTFLTSVDNKSTKYQPDHVFDPKTFPTRVPYTLPKLPHPPHPLPPKSGPERAKAPGAEPADGDGGKVKVVLKSGRNPKMELALSEVTGSTTIQSLKESVQSHLGGPGVVSAEKVKILLNKKPIPTSKITIAEALEGSDVQGQAEVELGVMVMGGAPDPPAQAADVPKPATPVPGIDRTDTPVSAAGGDAMEGVEKTDDANAAAKKSHGILGGPQFWSELEAFLAEKLPSSDQAKILRTTFENAWRSNTPGP